MINAKDCGAIGNGVVDDTTAIQDALNLLASRGGGSLYLPRGTYLTSAVLTIGGDDISLIGDGGRSKIMAKDSTSFEAVIYASGRKRLLLEDLVVDANKAGRAAGMTGRTLCIRLDGCEDSQVLACVAQNAMGGTTGEVGVGIAVAVGAVRNRVTSCVARDCGDPGRGADGYFLSGTQSLLIGCVATNCNDTGFVVESSNESGVIGCAVKTCGAGAAITNAQALQGHGNFISGLTIDGWSGAVTGGIQIGNPLSTSTGNLVNTTVGNVVIRNGSGTGPAINVRTTGTAKTVGLSFSNLLVDGAGTQGLLIEAEDVVVSGGVIRSTGTCVQLQAGSKNVAVKGMTLFASGSFAAYVSTGCDFVEIRDCLIKGTPGTTTWGIYCAGTSTNVRTGGNTMTGVTNEVGADSTTAPRSTRDLVFLGDAPA